MCKCVACLQEKRFLFPNLVLALLNLLHSTRKLQALVKSERAQGLTMTTVPKPAVGPNDVLIEIQKMLRFPEQVLVVKLTWSALTAASRVSNKCWLRDDCCFFHNMKC